MPSGCQGVLPTLPGSGPQPAKEVIEVDEEVMECFCLVRWLAV